MPSQTEAERQQCLAGARAAGIPEARIQQFIAENGWEDICRINTALAPNPGPGGTITPIFNIPGVTANQNTIYDPSRFVQAPASNPQPLSTATANAAPSSVPSSPLASVVTAPPASVPSSGSSSPLASFTAAPGAVTSPATPAATVPAATLAGFDSKTLMMVGAAVVVYLLVNR